MISPEDRFWIVGEAIRGNVHRSYIIDWDQRRWYMVSGPKTLLPPEEDKEIVVLERYINQLPYNAYAITVDDNGLLVSVSTNPEDDPTLIPYYPRYSDAPSLQGCLTIRLSSLTDLDRLGPGVDLMSYIDKAATKKVVFKYSMIVQWAQQIWKEMHLVKSFQHPNLVQFDRVVIDDVESRVLGFTTTYIPGGSLDQNRNRVFLLEWLQQLTAVVDYLNLELGVVHQDIAPRNLLIDPTTNKIRLFDFDRAAPVSQAVPVRNDVTGVIFTLYEIITEDGHLREVPFTEQDPQQVQSVEQWPVRCRLDSDVARFRKHLNDWVRRRTYASHGPNQVKWPGTPDMPPPSPLLVGHGETGEPIYNTSDSRKRSEVPKQRNVVIWERPPQQQSNCRR
jgi:serine/threonine protein kinase